MRVSFITNVLAFVMVAGATMVAGFQQQPFQPRQQHSSSTTNTVVLHMGLFDGFIKSMESGYAGGEDSPYAKIKQRDEEKRLESKRKAEERKSRGYTQLKDYNPKTQKTFAKLKYDTTDISNEVKEDKVSQWAKQAAAKKQESGFKFPWEKLE